MIFTKRVYVYNTLIINNLQKHTIFRENQSKVGLRGKESILRGRFLSEKRTKLGDRVTMVYIYKGMKNRFILYTSVFEMHPL